jgi:hypothetical protein
VLFAGGAQSDPRALADHVISVGCTDTEVFVSTKSALRRFESQEQSTVFTKATVIAIACSDTGAFFLDITGILWCCKMTTLIQVFGVPPTVSITTGQQYLAALSADGIGNDRTTVYPLRVLDHVALVACGINHTLAMPSAKRPPCPLEKLSVERAVARISRAELLF